MKPEPTRRYRGCCITVAPTREGDWLALVWVEGSHEQAVGERFSYEYAATAWAERTAERLEREAWLRANGQLGLPGLDDG